MSPTKKKDQPETETAEASVESEQLPLNLEDETGKELSAKPSTEVDLTSVPGMEGLELSFGSIPLIKLDKGEFICSEFALEDSFEAVLLSAKAKFFYKCADESAAIPFFYTYDHVETTNGEAVSDILDMWQQADMKSSPPSKYLEVLVKMVEQGNEFAMLSVSPKSIGRYTKYVSLDLAHGRKKNPQDVVTNVKVGPRIESRFPFRPWDFEYARDLDEAAAA